MLWANPSVNKIRSILKKLMMSEYNVPLFSIKGSEVTESCIGKYALY